MNIVISNDAIELIQKRLEELNKLAINNEIQTAISSFYLTYKNNLQNYYSYIGDIKKAYKDSYLSISNLFNLSATTTFLLGSHILRRCI